jgi:bisphosphoglycerate-independent phosphoglycerate mutase (AlkP superfamily)
LVDEELRKKEPAPAQSEQEKWGNPQGILCDVSPTILKLMDIPQPKEMTGKSLLPILK